MIMYETTIRKRSKKKEDLKTGILGLFDKESSTMSNSNTVIHVQAANPLER